MPKYVCRKRVQTADRYPVPGAVRPCATCDEGPCDFDKWGVEGTETQVKPGPLAAQVGTVQDKLQALTKCTGQPSAAHQCFVCGAGPCTEGRQRYTLLGRDLGTGTGWGDTDNGFIIYHLQCPHKEAFSSWHAVEFNNVSGLVQVYDAEGNATCVGDAVTLLASFPRAAQC